MPPMILTSDQLLVSVIRPALFQLGPKYQGQQAEAQLLTIALQETGIRTRVQQGNGPAHSFWQFEKNGIRAVLNNAASQTVARQAASRLISSTDVDAIWAAMATDDQLGCTFARLLMYCDPDPLPALADTTGSWTGYIESWRPGKPRVKDWPGNRIIALATLGRNGVHP